MATVLGDLLIEFEEGELQQSLEIALPPSVDETETVLALDDLWLDVVSEALFLLPDAVVTDPGVWGEFVRLSWTVEVVSTVIPLPGALPMLVGALVWLAFRARHR